MKLVNGYKIIVFLSTTLLLGACSGDQALKESQLNLSAPPLSSLDKWIEINYLDTYNINVIYKWNQNLVDHNRFLFPPTIEKVKPALEVVKKIWLDSYKTVGGDDFVKKIAPREFVFVGGKNMNTNGSSTLGIAEAGQRINLFEIDNLDLKDSNSVKVFIHTVQHEYIHILNQYVPYDELAFAKITPSGYTATWQLTETPAAREQGFITNYAKANINEDFAEMASIMLINSKEEYEAILISIESERAKADIRAKEMIVVKYFKEAFNIDFYKLREEAVKNTKSLTNI